MKWLWVICLFLSSVALATRSTDERCVTLSQVIHLLPKLPEQVFVKAGQLGTYPTVDLGITPFSVDDLLSLDHALREHGSAASRSSHPVEIPDVPGMVVDPIRVAAFERALSLQGGKAKLLARFWNTGAWEPEVEQLYRQGLPAVPDLHQLTIPNGAALATYWTHPTQHTERMVALTSLREYGEGGAVARIIKLPAFVARRVRWATAADKKVVTPKPDIPFMLEPLEFEEIGISPHAFVSLSLEMERVFFPLRMVDTLLANGQSRIRIPHPHFGGDAPIRRFRMQKSLLRKAQLSFPDRETESYQVAKAEWDIGFDQSFESPELRFIKGSRERLVLQPSGRPSHFGIPDIAIYMLTLYTKEGIPRELFKMYFYQNDYGKPIQMYDSALVNLFDRFMEQPDAVLSSQSSLSHHGLSSDLQITGGIPFRDGREIDFTVEVDMTHKKFRITTAQIKEMEPYYVRAFRQTDFDLDQTRWFSHRGVVLTPAMIAASMNGENTTAPENLIQMHSVITAYLKLHLPKFASYAQYYQSQSPEDGG